MKPRFYYQEPSKEFRNWEFGIWNASTNSNFQIPNSEFLQLTPSRRAVFAEPVYGV